MPSNKRGSSSISSSPAKKGRGEKTSEGDNNNREAEPVDGGQQQGMQLTNEQEKRLENIETIVTDMQRVLKETINRYDALNKYLNVDMEDEEMNADGSAGSYILKTSCLVAQLQEDVQTMQTTVVDRLDKVDEGLDSCRDLLGDSEHHTGASFCNVLYNVALLR